jgi:hypothetical protein
MSRVSSSSSHPLRAASRWAALVLVAATIASSCQCQPVPPEPSVIRAQAAASAVVTQATGIVSYVFSLQPQEQLAVVLKDEAGQAKGTLQLFAHENGDVEQLLVTSDGRKALRRSHLVQTTGGFWLRERLEAEGEVLLIEQFFNDDHEQRRLLIAVQGEPRAEAPTRTDGFSDAFVVVEDGTPAPEAELQAWMRQWPLQALSASPATLALLLVTQDEPFLKTLLEQVQPENTSSAEVLVQGIHKSDYCKDLPQSYSTAIGVACTFCAAFIPTLTPPVTLAAVMGLKSCWACGATAVLPLYKWTKCRLARNTAKTEEECKQECKPEENSSVDVDSDDCACECSQDKCTTKAAEIVTRGATICSAGCDNKKCNIYIQKCGNGRVERLGGCTEVCDPNAVPNGCQADEDCVECSKCVKREPPDSGVPDEPDAGVEASDAGDDETPDGGDPCNGECWEGTVCVNCGGYHCLPIGAPCCSVQGGFCNPGQLCGVCPDGRLTCIRPDGSNTCYVGGEF